MNQQSRMWLRVLVDYGALAAFGIAFVITHDLLKATPVLMIGSVIAVALGYVIERRLAPMPTIYGVFALVFGGLTLVFHDKSFIKMKPTFAYAAFAVMLGAGMAMKRNPLKLLLGSAVVLPDPAWRTLTIRYLLFFVASAIANEVVWRTQSDSFWVMYKIGYVVVLLLFSVSQVPFLMKHMQTDETPAPPEPPDVGF
ncbi:MAG: septation protein IspZ [Proteobacteria bacterium]|nr:septation protein IspZ [Pseudomonadota bacterium]